MHHMVTGASGHHEAAVVVELSDGTTDLGSVAGNSNMGANNLYQLTPMRLVGGGVVLELLVDVVKGIELGNKDVGTADRVRRPFGNSTTMARQIDAIAVVLGVGIDIDPPADANVINLVGHDTCFAQYASEFAPLSSINDNDIVGPFDVNRSGGDVGDGLRQYCHKRIDDKSRVGGRQVRGAEQE